MGTIEHRSKNTWRIGVQVKVAGKWQWVRVSLRMDPAHSEAVQRRDADYEGGANRMSLKEARAFYEMHSREEKA